MEESIKKSLAKSISERFDMREVDVRTYSPLALAYIGDCVFDLIIKTLVMSEGNQPVQVLHQKTSSIVQAASQSKMMRILQPLLTEDEHTVYKKGRNTKAVSPAKNQSLTDYRRATGFEAVIGYLYMTDQYERMVELVKMGLEYLEDEQ